MRPQGIHIEFVNMPIKLEAESEKQKRPVFKDVPHARVRWVGDNKRELFVPAHEKTEYSRDMERYITWAEKFPDQWEAFQRGQDQSAAYGTPLSEAPFLTEARRAELRALNVLTIEDLAGLEGARLQRAGPYTRKDVDQAKAYLEAASKFAEQSELREANAAMRAENDALKARMERLESMLERNDVIGSDIRAAKAAAPSATSPFDDMDDDTIRLWIEEQGGEKPHHKCSRETLIRKADELNAALKARKAA